MKKNFFKKLSFVLAGAMVLSTLTPASGAFAAKAPKLNSTSKYLHLGREKENKYNFNVSNKKSGWKYEWTSANEDVATINKKNGVVKATGVGSTKVSVVITDKDGEEVDELKAKVTVRDNIATVKVSNAPTEPIAVGAEYDFNRSYVTESGSSKKTSGITRWVVDSEKATINDKGVFVATEAGEYTVTARSFQSKAKYESWLTDAEKYAGYVNATDSVKVKVAASMVEAKQADLDTLKVTFDSAMTKDDVTKNLRVYSLVGNTKVSQTVKEVKMDDTNKIATVDLYVPFAKGTTIVVDYTDMESRQFVSATTNFNDVVRMTLDTTKAVAGEETELKVSLFDKNGVNITDGVDSVYGGTLLSRVDFKSSSNETYLDNNKLVIFSIGTTTQITATYHTYEYDTNGNEVGTIVAVGPVVGVKEATLAAGSIVAYTVVGVDEAADWKKVNQQLSISDNARLILKLKDTNDKEFTSDSDELKNNFTFTTSSTNVLIIDNNGYLYPVSQGSAVIVVKYGDDLIGTVTITVTPERKGTILTLTPQAFTLSNDGHVNDSQKVEAKLVDQYQKEIAINKISVDYVSGVKTSVTYPESIVDTNKVTFNAITGGNTGKSTYKITVNDDISRYVTITVLQPNDKGDLSDVKYKVDVNKAIDLVVKDDTDITEAAVSAGLFGYAPNGVKTTANVATGSAYEVEILNPDGKQVSTNGSLNLYNVASGKVIEKIKTGNYRVIARKDGKVIDSTFFTVSDTQPAPSLAEVKGLEYIDASSIEAAARECFVIKIDGKELSIVGVDYVGSKDMTTGDKYIKSVKVEQEFGGYKLIHEVKIGLNIKAK